MNEVASTSKVMLKLPQPISRLVAVAIVLSLLVCGATLPVAAQEEGLTFEQAQMRTAYARRQMEDKRRALKEAEDLEKDALQRLDDLKKRYEDAQKEAEMATKTRESAQAGYKEAEERWSAESQRLKSIHKRR